MKKQVFLASLFFASMGVTVYAGDVDHKITVEEISKQGISVKVAVQSERGPVVGAMVKITHNGMTIGAGTTDASGNVAISIPSYNKQLVRIDVTHAMYKEDKLVDVVLEDGKTFNFSLKPKTESLDAVAAKEAEQAARQEAAKKAAEDAEKQRQEIAKATDETAKQAEETRKLAEQKSAEAKAAQLEAEAKKKEHEARIAAEQAAREANMKKQQAEAEARRIETEKNRLEDTKKDTKAIERMPKLSKRNRRIN
ncbi:hypothetical protein ANCCEY_15002 [Ancylostoma ceylanicum]|uniref:TolA protein n=1 Tax=Ancylostoma ceylanicum TaxID=53326 RepID=A0A0D6L5K3_9BILA|nr:hypothetical protein ANCCEY_15002 [Ancylostoma ceylanicum]